MSTYVYAFARSSHPLVIAGMTGVGATAAPLRVVRADNLAAVVSDAPEGLRAKRRDLETHQRVVDALSRAGTVLPMRFGAVASDDAAVETELASGRSHYTELLTHIDGKVELNVKAAHLEDAVVREVLIEDPALVERRDALQTNGGGTYEQRLAFGESVAAAVEDRRARDASRVLSALRAHAAETTLGPPVDGCFLNASFLVAGTARQRFERSVAGLRRELAGLAELRLYGPLPPYSFVTVDRVSA